MSGALWWAKRNPAMDRVANRARLAGTLALEMRQPPNALCGIGDLDDARIERAIALIVGAKKLSHRPAAHLIFNRATLPPPEARARTA